MRQRTRLRQAGGVPVARLTTMLLFLIVLGMMYSRARDPQTWRWLAPEEDSRRKVVQAASASPSDPQQEPAPPPETVVAAPTDLDAEEAAEAANQFQAVADKEPIRGLDMPSYWRLLRWSRAQTFAEMEQRALRDVAYTQIWEQPDKYRGKPIRLRLHIRRVIAHEPETGNPTGVKQLWEAWGWTDESRSYPYVVLLSELPPGMEVGTDARVEGVFVGYLLKVMAYTAHNGKTLASPMLIGRLKLAAPAQINLDSSGRGVDWMWVVLGGIGLLIVVGGWLRLTRRPVGGLASLTEREELAVEDWLRDSAANPSAADPGVEPAGRSMPDP
jgi:hypothetical protein